MANKKLVARRQEHNHPSSNPQHQKPTPAQPTLQSDGTPSQAAQLMNLDAPQGQAMLMQLSRVQGNRHVQRLVQHIQTSASGTQPGISETAVDQALSGGSPLPAAQRSFFESRMGHDFGDVRVHTGDQADATAQALDAQAFTRGRDIAFRKDNYNPHAEDGQALLAHELTHVVQQGAAKPNAADGRVARRAPVGHIQRWSGHEHKAFGDNAAAMAGKHKALFQIPIGIPHGENKTMSLGEATELSGDYTGSPEALASAKSADPTDVAWTDYLALASTNINHFFPLADKEWRTQHGKALGLAGQAREAYGKGKDKAGKRLTEQALQTEAFGLHFLQDSFASGHQYPRALEAVDAGKFTTGFWRGAKGSKNYHDALCALPDGLATVYGGKFHGDDKAEPAGQDQAVTQETYNALAQVLGTISGKKPSDAKPPRPNPGPDIAKIMQDPDAGPIWYSLEHSIVDLLQNARDNKDGTVTTSSGIKYNLDEILEDWDARSLDEAALKKLQSTNPDLATRLIDTVLSDRGRVQNLTRSGMGGPSSLTLDHKADDAILDLLKNDEGVLDVNKVPPTLTAYQTVLLCQALISGACIGNDEHAVLFILRRQKPEVFRKAVEQLTPQYIDSGLDGDEWDAFLLVAAHRYPAGQNLGARLISKEKNDDAARMLITGSHGEPPVPMDKLSPYEWIHVIRALLSGVCGDQDEDAIVAIVRHLVATGKADLVDLLIGESKMDGGVDGKQWRQVRDLMNGAGYEWD